MSFQQTQSLGFFSSNSLSSIQPVSPAQDIIPVPRPKYNQHHERPSRQLQSRQNSGRTHCLPGRTPSGSGGYNGYESSSGDTFILQIACMATAEVLIQANNLTYINAIQHQQQAQTRLEDSIHERDRTAYNSLLTRLDSLSLTPSLVQARLQGPSDSLLPITMLFKIPSVPIHVPLQWNDYPSVRYWDKKAFTDPFDNQKKAKSTAFLSSSSRSSNHEKVLNTDYFEDENGQPVSKAHVCSAYEEARKIWNYFHDNGCAPVNYTDANRDHLQYFQHHLGISYPELYLGEGFWKFQYLWSANYGSWKNKNTIKARIKIEDTSESHAITTIKAAERTEGSIFESLGDGSHSSKKRRREEPDQSSNKKLKMAVSSRALEK
ncbi:hypothetical protein F5146DRAFT_1139760 [Armillaria mellea]|nr:hypothetical protein F5146DRAFT_1139760 [Armillaria mellea]